MSPNKSYETTLANGNPDQKVKFTIAKVFGRVTLQTAVKIEAAMTSKGAVLLRRKDYTAGTQTYNKFDDLQALANSLNDAVPEEAALKSQLTTVLNAPPPPPPAEEV